MLDKETYDRLKEQLGSHRVWGVVSSFSTDKLHEHLTLAEAVDRARHESEREAGRNASVVLVVKHFHGAPL
jgi:hypothetical protein